MVLRVARRLQHPLHQSGAAPGAAGRHRGDRRFHPRRPVHRPASTRLPARFRPGFRPRLSTAAFAMDSPPAARHAVRCRIDKRPPGGPCCAPKSPSRSISEGGNGGEECPRSNAADRSPRPSCWRRWPRRPRPAPKPQTTPQTTSQIGPATAAVSIGATDIGGVVTGPNGPEAGVWVIAETTELPHQIRQDRRHRRPGRYVIPDLPKANYKVWVRGYGLVDAPKVDGTPGKAAEPDRRDGAEPGGRGRVLPGMYWYSMLQHPGRRPVPRHRRRRGGNGIPAFMNSQAPGSTPSRQSCQSCHALGTRTSADPKKELGEFPNSTEAVGAAHPVRARR